MYQILTISLLFITITNIYTLSYANIPKGKEQFNEPFTHDTAGLSPPILSTSHGGTLINNERHKVIGHTVDSKDVIAGKLDYLHKPSGSGISVVAQTRPNVGSDIAAVGKYNVRNTPESTMYAQGYFMKHFNSDKVNTKRNKNYDFTAGISFTF